MANETNQKSPCADEINKISDYGSIDPHSLTSIELKPTTYWETFTNMIKGNVGCGILAMGMVYKNGGLLFSTILILIVALISGYNQYTLVQMANEFQALYKCGRLSFSRTIWCAFKKGPPIFQKSANLAWFTVEMFIVITQLGICCMYFMFVSSSLKQIFDLYGIHMSISSYMKIILPVIWATALIRELKYIAPLSTLANISIFSSLGLIMFCNIQNLPPISERVLMGSWENIPLCFGTVVAALEGICLILPLQQNMMDKQKFLGVFGVLNLSIGVIASLMITLGFFGYYKHGDNVAGALTFNLDINYTITQIVICSMVFSILFTYALQFFLPVLILLPWIQKHTSTWPLSSYHLYEYILRSVLVLFTFFVAMNVPHYDLFISLIGAVGSSFLALIYTPIADIILIKHRKGSYWNWRVPVAIISIVIGILGFFIGTSVSLKELIVASQKDHITNSA